VDAVVVEALVQVEVAVPRLHNHHPQCKVSASPGCTQNLLHHLDKDHKKTSHPICSNNTETWCQGELGLVVLELALERVWALDLVMALAMVMALAASALAASALVLVSGLEHQGNLNLHRKP